MTQFRKSTALKMLKRLKKVCLKMENKMIYTWAMHCEKVSQQISIALTTFKNCKRL